MRNISRKMRLTVSMLISLFVVMMALLNSSCVGLDDDDDAHMLSDDPMQKCPDEFDGKISVSFLITFASLHWSILF